MPGPLRMTIVGLVALAAAGCGTSAHDAVRAKVQQFATASAHHDYKTICDQVLAPALTAHLRATGVSCEQAWQLALGSITPTLSVGKITITGSSATAIVLTFAPGQRSSLDALQLAHTGSGWRIESLDSSLTQAASG